MPIWLVVSLESASPNESLELGPQTVLVYRSQSGTKTHQFVSRLARFGPDILFEWESLSGQGTVHLFQKGVQSAQEYTVSKLFEVGVDSESSQTTTLWLSVKLCRSLIETGKVKLKLDRLAQVLEKTGEGLHDLTIDKVPSQLRSILVKDQRGQTWSFLNNPENCLLLEYTTPHYHQQLESVTKGGPQTLRWIKNPAPIR